MSIGKRHNYKNLKIWQLTLEIANNISGILLNFPTHEKYSLNSQISRCSISIPSNIAEASNRNNIHFKHFLNIAFGSSFEIQTQILITKQNNYISEIQTTEIENKIVELQKMISGFIKRLDSQNLSS